LPEQPPPVDDEEATQFHQEIDMDANMSDA
jgi:hypothetical protein